MPKLGFSEIVKTTIVEGKIKICQKFYFIFLVFNNPCQGLNHTLLVSDDYMLLAESVLL